VVFGVVVNGEARAYPKRILAWHELVLDRLGDVDLTVVFCTLCGTVIPYESTIGGERYNFGTSGFLYKSNKLLFDEETNSLWSSVYGKPVIGALVGSELELKRHPVVTTSWAEWRASHPDTTVLSLETGYDKDYREGAAYRDYFRHDRLMFAVDERDDRLKNKEEVLVLLAEPAPLAIAVARLAKQPLLQTDHRGRQLLVLTSPSGASRVYEIGDEQFVEWVNDAHVRDAGGGIWRVGEDGLVSVGSPATRHPRLPAHRAFWFAWYAHYPDTELIR
jgi:hypothetical protein